MSEDAHDPFPSPVTSWPFKVGDRIHELRCTMEGWDKDTLRPDAIVTELTDKGFKYDYVRHVSLGARYGHMTGGHCLPEGYDLWMLVEAARS